MISGYPLYLLTRLGQFALVVFIGINIAFIVTHATPIDPVEQTIAAATQFGSTSPEAIELMRRSLRELYGLQGDLGQQYVAFWRRVVVGDFGPSLSAFPTPVAVLMPPTRARSRATRLRSAAKLKASACWVTPQNRTPASPHIAAAAVKTTSFVQLMLTPSVAHAAGESFIATRRRP